MDFLLRLIDFALSRQEQVLEGLAQHTWYVITVLVTAGLFAIVTGVVTRRNLLAKELALALASVFLTIPSLALFVIFIPLVGLGFAPSFIALFLYSLLPILRNTITGLDGIDPGVLDAAKGMGLSPIQGRATSCLARDFGRRKGFIDVDCWNCINRHPGRRWRTG